MPDPIAPCAVAAGAAIFGRGNQDLVTVPLPLRVQVPDCSNGDVASITVGLTAARARSAKRPRSGRRARAGWFGNDRRGEQRACRL